MYDMQHVYSYDVYLLDTHVDRRFLDARGWDVYSDYKRDEGLPSYMEELFSIRLMRHLYHFHPNMSQIEWELFFVPLCA